MWSCSLDSRDSRLEDETPEGDEDTDDRDDEAKEASSKESLCTLPATAPVPGVWKGRGIYPTEEYGDGG